MFQIVSNQSRKHLINHFHSAIKLQNLKTSLQRITRCNCHENAAYLHEKVWIGTRNLKITKHNEQRSDIAIESLQAQKSGLFRLAEQNPSIRAL